MATTPHRTAPSVLVEWSGCRESSTAPLGWGSRGATHSCSTPPSRHWSFELPLWVAAGRSCPLCYALCRQAGGSARQLGAGSPRAGTMQPKTSGSASRPGL